MKYKAIIFDLDETVVPSIPEGMPSKQVIEAVRKVKGKIKLSSASGRSVDTCRHIWQALSLEDPCIINGGSQIINPQTEEIIWEQLLPQGVISRIIAVSSGFTDRFAVNGKILNVKQDRKTFPKEANIIVAFGVPKDKAEELVRIYLKIPGVEVHILPSWVKGDFWDIHVTHKMGTKRYAIGKLIEILGVKREEVIGVGDGNNDIPLFESVGYKVAMGHAVEALKKSADYITDDLKHDGFAKFLEEKIINN